MSARYLSLFCLVVFVSCDQPEARLTSEEKQNVIREARQALDDYFSANRNQGLTAEFDYLDQSDEFFWVPPGSSIPLSYDSIRKILIQNAPRYKTIDNVWDTLRIIPLTRDLAMYTGRLKSEITDSSGLVSNVKLVETGLMVKRKEGWRLQSGQTSILPE